MIELSYRRLTANEQKATLARDPWLARPSVPAPMEGTNEIDTNAARSRRDTF
jgi:hypothetical protein